MDYEYEQIIKKAAESKSSKIILNSSLEHACIGLEYLINTAKSKIRIVSNEFWEGCWDELYPHLNNFLKKDNVEIEIVILKDYEKGRTIKKISKEFSTKVKVYKFSQKDTKKMPNFVTIDTMGYRFELSDEEKKNKIVKGVINFGDEAITNSLNEIFEVVKNASSLEVVCG